eukprot:TRINITY_DN13096_c0_g1_i1.p1 TRINITY_DN13096_c0_g1~~TRINITY_DN13096_c0_g1_i1.p1  ORF type:complete len:351 (+),score=124.19 TRINITY_DN13096_c0_g1_i1:46-1053(+)
MTTIQITGEPMVMTNEELQAKRPLTEDEVNFIQGTYVFPRPYLTDDQKRMLQQMKERLADVITDESEDDVFILRYLIARNWDMALSEKMFRDGKVWKASTLPLRFRSEALLRFIKFKIVEVRHDIRDRFNRPLVIITGSRYNPGLNHRDHSIMQDTFTWAMEYIISLLKKPFPQFTLILDLENWGLGSFDPKLAKSISAIAKPYYPDYMGTTYIINYPWVIWGVWKLAEVLLEEHTKKKIHFVAKADYQKLFPLLFDADRLYTRFGGNAEEAYIPPSEFDSAISSEWKKGSALPKEEREAFFDQKLEEHLQTLPEAEANFWREMQHTANFSNIHG